MVRVIMNLTFDNFKNSSCLITRSKLLVGSVNTANTYCTDDRTSEGINTMERCDENIFLLTDGMLENSNSVIKPQDQSEVDNIVNQEKMSGEPSWYSSHKLAGRVTWGNEIIIHFGSPMDFMCFGEYFSLYRLYQFFPSKFWKYSDDKDFEERSKRWVNNLPQPATAFFDVQSLYVALKDDYLTVTRTGEDLKIHKYLVDRFREITYYADQGIQILHFMPAFVTLSQGNGTFLVDPRLSMRPFELFDFFEEHERIITLLEDDLKFQEEFPYDLRTFLFYESIKQKTLNLRMFNSKEVATEKFYFLNLNLKRFYKHKETAFIVMRQLSKIVRATRQKVVHRCQVHYGMNKPTEEMIRQEWELEMAKMINELSKRKTFPLDQSIKVLNTYLPTIKLKTKS